MPRRAARASSASRAGGASGVQGGVAHGQTAPQQGESPTAGRGTLRLLGHWCSAAVAGVSTLGLLRVLAPVLGFTIKINAATLALSALLGMPGVVLLLALRAVFF